MTFENLTSPASTERALTRAHARIEQQRRRHRPILIGTISAVALATTAGGIAVVQANTAQLNNQTRCFSAWSTTSEFYDSVDISDPNHQTNPDLKPLGQRVADAIESCEAGWRSGLWPTKTPPGPLKACQLNDGRIAVLPQETGQGCKDLGISEPQ